MGPKKSTEAKNFLKNKFIKSFKFYEEENQFTKYLKHRYPNHTKHILWDIGLTMIVKLGGMKNKKKIRGKDIVNYLLNDISKYVTKSFFPKYVVLNMDGDVNKRPTLKVDRTKKHPCIINVNDLKVSDEDFPTYQIWMDNRSNNDIRKKVLYYLTDKISKLWNIKYPAVNLLIDSAVLKNDLGTLYYTAVEVSNKIIYENTYSNTYEADQTVSYYTKILDKKYPKSIFVWYSNDTDFIAYGILTQKQINKESNIFVRSKHYRTIIDGTEEFYSANLYALNIKTLSIRIKKFMGNFTKCNSIDLFTIIFDGILGNDFCRGLTSIIRGITYEKIFKYIKKFKTRQYIINIIIDNKPYYSIIKDDWIFLLNNISNKYLNDVKQKNLKENLNESEWFLNYMINSCDPRYLTYQQNKKGKRKIKIKNVKINKKNKKIKF